ncbi:MAG TPA: signal peptidase II [Bryobacteraceae bacterium]
MSRLFSETAIIAAVVALDRVTKLYIQHAFSPSDVKPVIPGFFNIVHWENPGAAFGFLADSPTPWSAALLVAVSLSVMAVIAVMLWRPGRVNMLPNTPLMRVALSLVFGGALGNLWDRLFRGTVTDFLQFYFGSYEFPSFNVADSMITIGAGLLLIDLWLTRHHQPVPQSDGASGVSPSGPRR